MNEIDTKEFDEPANRIYKNNISGKKLKESFFFIGITGIFLISGFSSTLSTVRRNSPKLFKYDSIQNKTYEGTELALRALGWGSLYSSVGCSLLFYSMWKLSGAKSFEEFRQQMQKILPKISKSNSSLQ